MAAVTDLLFLPARAEPVLTRIKENRKRIISPSFDNIKYDNFEIEEYPLAAQGFDWELWCRYLNPPKAWWKLENSTAPIRYGTFPSGLAAVGLRQGLRFPPRPRVGGTARRRWTRVTGSAHELFGPFSRNHGSNLNSNISEAPL